MLRASVAEHCFVPAMRANPAVVRRSGILEDADDFRPAARHMASDRQRPVLGDRRLDEMQVAVVDSGEHSPALRVDDPGPVSDEIPDFAAADR